MRINKFALLLGLIIAAVLFAEVAAHADAMDQSTKMTFSKPVEIPGQTLPAGTYLFKLPNADNLNLVQITSLDGGHVYATLETNETERPEGVGDTVLVVADGGAGKPVAILKWFYPGNTDGHQFVYSDREEEQIAQNQRETIVTKRTPEAGN